MKRVTDRHIQRMRAGDPYAFEDIVSWYAPGVLRLAYLLLQDRQEAEDVLQEALLKLVNKIKDGSFQNRNGSVQGFLLTCARNLCIDLLRKRSRFSSLDEFEAAADAVPDPQQSAWTRLRDDDLYTQLDWALSTLSTQQRTILVLYEVNGESYEKIARTLNIRIETVRKSLYRTRKKLRELLEPCRGEV